MLMRPRRIILLATIASTAMFTIAFAISVRSFWMANFVGKYNGRGGSMGLVSTHGTIKLYYTPTGYGGAAGYYFRRDNAASWRNGNRWFAFHLEPAGGGFSIVFPHAVVCFVFGIPLVLCFRLLKKQRGRRGFEVVQIGEKRRRPEVVTPTCAEAEVK